MEDLALVSLIRRAVKRSKHPSVWWRERGHIAEGHSVLPSAGGLITLHFLLQAKHSCYLIAKQNIFTVKKIITLGNAKDHKESISF